MESLNHVTPRIEVLYSAHHFMCITLNSALLGFSFFWVCTIDRKLSTEKSHSDVTHRFVGLVGFGIMVWPGKDEKVEL